MERKPRGIDLSYAGRMSTPTPKTQPAPAPGPATPGDPLLRLEAVDVITRDGEHLCRVDWELRAGELWIVSGLPGCGKTQVLQTAAGLARPGSGALTCLGKPFDAFDDTNATQPGRTVGFVFANGGRPLPNLTVAQNIALPICYQRGCPWEETGPEVDALLELAGLAEHAAKLPAEMPRAALQRLGLARALALRPRILFLDNPTTGLNARHADWWQQTLAALAAGTNKWAAEPMTLAVAVDDPVPWLRVGNRFALIHQGRFNPAALTSSRSGLDHPAWRDLLAESGETS